MTDKDDDCPEFWDEERGCIDCGQCEETVDSMEEFEAVAYKSFLTFPEGVEYDETTGTITLSPKVQAHLVLSMQSLKTKCAEALNVLAALKFTVKTGVDPVPEEVKKALILADCLIEDPEGVEISGVDTALYDIKSKELN